MIDAIRNQSGESLDFTLHNVERPDSDLFVVIGHGVTANKDRPFVRALAETLQEAGIPSLRFSFAGNGDSEGRFEDSTVSKETEDLGSVLDAVTTHVPGRRIVYAGHSMGGAVGALRASADDRIDFLISLAGMVGTRDFCERKFGDQEPGSSLMWNKPECPLSQTYVDDMNHIDSTLPQAREVTVPWLLIHGDDDTVVPHSDAEQITAALPDSTTLVTLGGADHVFSGDATDQMTAAVTEWLQQMC